MSILNDLKSDLSQATTFKTIAETFVEINALKIKKIHQEFTRNQRFYNEITNVYHTVKLSAARQNFLKIKGQKSTKSAPPKVLLVALTSNSRFYGPLNYDVMGRFYKEARTISADRLVIGQSGLDYISLQDKNFVAQMIRFKRDLPTPDETDLFVKKTRVYEKILIYYPKFLTMLSQKAEIEDITQSAPSDLESRPTKEFVENLFEPELPKILAFFEDQVRSLLFKRVLLETELSRTAARLISMNEASYRSDTLIKKKRGELVKAQRSLSNSRLLEVFSGIKQWRGIKT